MILQSSIISTQLPLWPMHSRYTPLLASTHGAWCHTTTDISTRIPIRVPSHINNSVGHSLSTSFIPPPLPYVSPPEFKEFKCQQHHHYAQIQQLNSSRPSSHLFYSLAASFPSKRSRISKYELIRARSFVANFEPIGTLGVPSISKQALSCPYFTPLASYSRLEIFWAQLDTVPNRSDIDVVGHLPESGRRSAHLALVYLFQYMYQVSETHLCFHLCRIPVHWGDA